MELFLTICFIVLAIIGGILVWLGTRDYTPEDQ